MRLINYLNNVVKKRCITFLISDFLNPDPSSNGLNDLKNSVNIIGKRHDLIGLHIYDEREARLPKVGLIRVIDAETKKEYWIDTNNDALLKKYSKGFIENLQRIKDLFGKSGAQLESIKTENNYVVALMNMFKHRELRRH